MQGGGFLINGYTGGCPGCIHIQRDRPGSRNHNEGCSKIIEELVSGNEAEAARKRRADVWLDDQLIRALATENDLLKEKEAATEGEHDAPPAWHTPLKSDVVGDDANVDGADANHLAVDVDMESPITLQPPPALSRDETFQYE